MSGIMSDADGYSCSEDPQHDDAVKDLHELLITKNKQDGWALVDKLLMHCADPDQCRAIAAAGEQGAGAQSSVEVLPQPLITTNKLTPQALSCWQYTYICKIRPGSSCEATAQVCTPSCVQGSIVSSRTSNSTADHFQDASL